MEWWRKMRVDASASSPKVSYAIRRNSCEDAYREVSAGLPVKAAGSDREQGTRFSEFAAMLSGRHHHGTAVELLRLADPHVDDSRQERAQLLHALALSCLNLAPENEIPSRPLELAIALDPQRHQSYFLLGRACRKRREPRRNAAALERSIQMKPDAAAYYAELGRLLAASTPDGSSGGKAIETLSKAVEIDPSEAAARYELARVWIRGGRSDEAADQLRRAIEAEPEFYEAYNVLGRIHARERRPVQARAYLEEFQREKAASEARSTTWKEATVQPATEQAPMSESARGIRPETVRTKPLIRSAPAESVIHSSRKSGRLQRSVQCAPQPVSRPTAVQRSCEAVGDSCA